MLSTNRIVWLDYSKAIAIILVVLFHSGLITNRITSPLLAICIPLFFTTNGALVLIKNRRIDYYVTKVFKIIFLYLFWGTVLTITTMLSNGEMVSLSEVVSSVINLRMGYAHIYWFLCTLVALYCIYPAIQLAVRTSDVRIFLLIVSFILSFKLFGYRIPLFHIPNIFTGWESECVFYAVCGYSILLIDFKEQKNSRLFVLLAIFICAYAIQLLMYSVYPFFSNHTPKSVDDAVFSMYKSPCIMIMTAISFIALKIAKLPQNRLIQIIGENTLGIYVTHGLFMKVAIYFFNVDNPILMSFILFILGFVLSVLFSYLMSTNKYSRFFVSL